MRLGDATAGDVVQNESSRRFYRYERPERDRVRIRPLELFPSGLLLPKPIDTIVETAITVLLIGRWQEPMYVDPGPNEAKGRASFEQELRRRQRQLDELLLEAEEIDPRRRGSHANKVKAAQDRVNVLSQGLASAPADHDVVAVAAVAKAFSLKQPVQLPSGQPGLYMGAVTAGAQSFAQVRCRVGGVVTDMAVAPEVLQPLAHRHIATVSGA